jgi:Ca-activated chloride channel family protein
MSERMIDLRTANPADRIALRGVRVNATLVGMTARTVLEQTFVNQEDKAVEAVYTFPLPEDGAVCSFEIVLGDRVLTGVVDEREQAIEKYENAINQGDSAFLLEQERPDIFTVRVGNLLPKQAVTVRLTYVQPLDVNDAAIRFALPTTVAPRYVTATGSDPVQMQIDADAINPPAVLQVPYGLNLAVHVDLGREVRSISSSSHAIRIDRGENHQYRISFAGGVAEMDRDVVIELKLAKEVAPSVQVGEGPDGAKYLAVSFLPEFEERDLAKREPAEVIFVLDCSSSMHGDSIREAKAALQLCLRSLNLGDRFNICCFGSRYELLHPEPVVYSDATLKDAIQYVQGIEARLGGTELLPPLQTVLTTPTTGVRQLIVLTDGEISNEAAVMKLARTHRAQNRIFAFGIGHAPSASLVRGLARASAGAAEFISPGENIADKVLRTFSRLSSPSLTDVEVDFALAEATLATPQLPAVFDGDMLTLYARVSGKLPETVTLRARHEGGEKQWTAKLAPPRGDEPAIATTWARRMIQTLEDDAQLNRQRLLEISRRFNLVCSLTAFVAIEHRSIEDRNDGKPELRRIPIQLAHGWGGFHRGGAAGGVLMDCLSAAPAQAMDSARYRSAPATPTGKIRSQRRGISSWFRTKADAVGEVREEIVSLGRPPAMSPLQELLALQSAEGWFDLGSAPSWVKDLVAKLATPAKPQAADRVEWTRSTLAVLKSQFAAEEPIWKAAYEKALRYLAKATGKPIAELQAELAAST